MLDPEFRRLTHGIPMLTEALMEDEEIGRAHV